MKPINSFLVAACIAVISPVAQALDVGESDLAWMSELAKDGFEPFAVSSAAKASFGMIKGTDMYMCFLADNREDQERRQKTLLANMKDATASRTVPNLPYACVLAQ